MNAGIDTTTKYCPMGLPITLYLPPLHKLRDVLFKDRSPAFSYGLAVLLAALFIAYLFPPAFFSGNSAFFEQIDASQHVAGWLFYVQDAWHFPLLHTERLNHPEGVSIAFTDSIPLAALLFKLVARWLPASFHYIGWWHAVAFVLQAVAATFLIRVFDLRHAVATICATLFALTWPALLWRLGHTSLMTHALILFALAFYFLGRQGKWSGNAAAAGFIVLNIVGLTVHPYFLAFCYALFLAFLADQALAGEGWGKQIPRLLASIVTIGVVGWVLGYFGHGGTTTFGYGYYSMNLYAPFCGGRFIHCAQSALQHQFSEYSFADATGGQYEGHNYLGAGTLLLVPFALIAGWRSLPTLPRRYPALITILMLLTLYAISNRIYLGAQEIFSYPLPAFLTGLTGTFRSSGRFFWPVGYLLLFVVLASVLKTRSMAAMLLLALALPLQWLDVQPLTHRIMEKASKPSTNDLDPWSTAMSAVDKIEIYPAFGCGDADVNMYWFFQRLAAHYGKLLNTGYVARPNVNCEDNARAYTHDFLERHLYVMPSAYLSPFSVPGAFRTAIEHDECVKWQAAVLCKARANRTYWEKTGLAIEPVAALKKHGEWGANALPTQVGILRDGRLVPAITDKPGFLSFGPYIGLPSGRYHYTIHYASQSAPLLQVGRWDVALSGAVGRELAAGPLFGTNGADGKIEGTFTTDNARLPLEIRTFFNGSGDLQLIGIALEKISQ